MGLAVPYGNSKTIPFEKRYFAGGANGMRGWTVRGLGPGSYKGSDKNIDFINQSGDLKLDWNIELRSHLFWKLHSALFVDAGNIWTLRSSGDPESDMAMFRWDTFSESIAANWGLGLRLNFGFLLLRLDMGMKIHDPARLDKWVRPEQWLHRDGFALHFGVGYPF